MKSKFPNALLLDIGGNGVQYKFKDEIQQFSTLNKDKTFVLNEISKISNENKIEYISVSSPGACNTKTGWIDGLSGIENYGNFNFYKELLNLLDNKETTIIINNDANCSLAANLSKTSVKNAVQINIGTGIGGAIAFGGNIITGANGYAGEFGYGFTNKEKVNVSQKLSSNALVKRFDGKYNNAKEIFENATETDIFCGWLSDLAKYIISLNYSFDPEVIFLSGGITNNKNFIDLVNKEIENILNHNEGYTLKPKIKISSEQNDGIVGAEYLLEKLCKK